ncbi:MAG: SusC/RagA family TonB-linked outer membrane protein [Bacteroidetes bacterium]|nr:SusC/RagA family TonB-linked outer membrane protein [Bacteroidota bacterium]
MRRFTIWLTCLFFLISIGVANAQTSVVTGTVTGSEDGLPIPGVTIVVPGTTDGTTTDLDGKYTLSVKDEYTTLRFQFVGMITQELPIGSATTINVALDPDILLMDEVVVTALGVSREKKSLGYASQTVSEAEIVAVNNVNVMSSLSGKVAGLTIAGQNFAGSRNILIRGASSFSGNNQPLFVVDGIPIRNDNYNTMSTQGGGGGYDYGSMSDDINPNDIESIDVLKGSAASSLYGSRGQNGVIMITTKSGKKGKQSFKVEFNSGINFEQMAILPELQNSYGGGYDFSDVVIDGVTYQIPDYGVDETWGPKFEGQDVLHWWGAEDYYKGITSTPETAPWVAPAADVDEFYETGVSYTNSFNIITTAEKSAVRIGYTNVDMTGTHPNSSQKKHSMNINGSANLLDDIIELTSAISYVKTETTGRPQFGYGDNSQSQKFFQWGQRQLDFDRLSNYLNPDGTMRTWNRNSLTDGTPHYSDNPYWTAYKNYQDDDRNRMFGKVSVKANINDDLFATGTVYLDTYTFNQRTRVALGSQALSEYSLVVRQNTEVNLEGKLNYKKTINDFSLLGMIGSNSRSENYMRLDGITNGGLVINNLWNLNNSVGSSIVDQFNRRKNVKSWFGSASIGYKNMLYLDVTYRTDYDSSLPEDNNAYGYKSSSLNFIISELLDYYWLNNLKVRANYGESGAGTDPYSVYTTYLFSDPFGGPTFTNPTELNNQFLLPETTEEVEFGVEAVFFNSRLGFDFSYYNRNTFDQIVPVEVSGASGYTTSVINAGKINNKGIELMVFGTPVQMKDFTWDINVNFAKNKNTVLDLPEDLPKIQLARAPFGGAYINSVEGATFQELWVFDYEYDDNGNKIIDQSTGFYSTDGELKSVGSVLPDYTAGIRNSFKYKNFDLSALIDVSHGGVYYSLTTMWGMYSGMAAASATPTTDGNTIREDGVVLDGVAPDGTPNTISIDAYDYATSWYHGFGTPSATSVFDASYIKLREVTFGYTLPKVVDFIKSMKVSIYGRNLLTWGLGNKGIDPETIVGGSGNVQGLEGGIIPSTRSFGFNVLITL